MTTTQVGSADDVRDFLHQLRNRMTVIGGYLSLAQSPGALADEAKRRAYIEAAIAEVGRAADLVGRAELRLP